MNKFRLVVILVFTFSILFSQEVKKQDDHANSLIHWITIQEALEKQKTQPKGK